MLSVDQIKIGQCWISEAEPELGLGFVTEVSHHHVMLKFPAQNEARRYGRKAAPIKRVRWQIGDQVQARNGKGFKVERVDERDGVLWYLGGGIEIAETEVSARAQARGPLGRLQAGQWDTALAYALRGQALEHTSRLQCSPWRGFWGPRAALIPHQTYVVSEVASRAMPRALLADEVGLGKTIEAGWIMHQWLVTGKMQRALVLAPQAMLNQWFVELHRRFNFTFRVPESQSGLRNPREEILEQDLVILSIESLQNERVREALADSSWEMIVVDEAHRIGWTQEKPSREYELLSELTARARGVLLLTATPEQLGLEGHFGRLHLLDPQRFGSFEKFAKEHDRYNAVARMAEALVEGKKLTHVQKAKLTELLQDKVAEDATREDIIRALVDHFGTGRVYFRNARSVVQAESYRFPERRVHAVAVPGDRVAWLKTLLDEHRNEKFLVICSSRALVEQIDKQLQQLVRVNTAMFHEGQSLLVRDRAAAYFAESNGARVLFSSEIGSEGRNFQFARHLVLWDLPRDPDLLEQRIGRLDRIGQAQEFHLHVPFAPGTAEEGLCRWYAEVFSAFERPATGAGTVHARYESRLNEALSDRKALDKLISNARADYELEKRELERGRDRLVEINSFDASAALGRVAALEEDEGADSLREFMESAFSWAGVEEQDLDENSVFVEPGDGMFIPVFPGLPNQGLRFTYDRAKALAREDLALLSWDHPMVRGVLELLLTRELGSTTIARWREPRMQGKTSLVECVFVWRCSADPRWNAETFLPLMPLREVVDVSGRLVTGEWSRDALEALLTRLKVKPEDWRQAIIRDRLPQLVETADARVRNRAEALRTQALERMHKSIDAEIVRLAALARKNGLVSERELLWWDERRVQLERAFTTSELALDSLRVVF